MEEIPIWFHPIPHLPQNNLRKLAIAPDRWLATRQYHPFQAHCLQSESRNSKMPWHFGRKNTQPVTLFHTTKKCNFASSCDFWMAFFDPLLTMKDLENELPTLGMMGFKRIHTKGTPTLSMGFAIDFRHGTKTPQKWRNQETKLPQIQSTMLW